MYKQTLLHIQTLKAGPAKPDQWRRYPGVNCYQGQGGDPIQPDPLSNSLSLSQCQAACEADTSCEGIITQAGNEAAGLCYKRRNLDLGSCVSDPKWNLFIKSSSGGNLLCLRTNCKLLNTPNSQPQARLRDLPRPPLAPLRATSSASTASSPTRAPCPTRTTTRASARPSTTCGSSRGGGPRTRPSSGRPTSSTPSWREWTRGWRAR